MVLMPAQHWRAILNDVSRRLQDALFIRRTDHLIVWAKKIEVDGVKALKHEGNRLFRRPGTIRFCGTVLSAARKHMNPLTKRKILKS
jgi:hypothetical protein